MSTIKIKSLAPTILKAPTIKVESTLEKVLAIIRMDILCLIYGERIKKPAEWGDYDRWCRMIRGEP